MAGAAAGAVRQPAPPDAEAEAEAVRRARDGDREAFRVLVERHQGRAYRLALRVLRDEEGARDVVQDAFLKAWGSLDRFEGRSGFYTWLYRIVMNLCLDRRRRSRTRREVEWSEAAVAEAGTPALADSGAAPDEALDRSQLRGLLARAIQALPDDARRTIELREIDGLSYQEIAQALGIPKGTVMSRLHYARRRLAAALQAAGVEDFAGAEEDR
jgi:RNA polymerase sigma-70 factor (ECF subfamily)